MDTLPQTLPILDAALRDTRRCFERVAPRSQEGKQISEADVDRLVSTHTAVLADALRSASVLPGDSSLRVVGQQIDGVDVLLAEVEGEDDPDGVEPPSGWGALRRLVLVEDKLLRNPEARRQVLAQILDYAAYAEREWPGGGLTAKAPTCSNWLNRNSDRLDYQLQRQEFLLLVVADSIDPSLLRLARRFAAQENPLNLTELCLVSLAIYANGDDRLLVPHVVSTVERHSRALAIEVTVVDSAGAALPASVARAVPESPASAMPRRPEVASFLRKLAVRVAAADYPSGHPYTPTAKPRKSLEYWLALPDLGTVRCKAHFGGYNKHQWSPIDVGFWVEAGDTDGRDWWMERLRDCASAGKLPEGTQVTLGGPRTVCALKTVPWDAADDLNDALLQRVTDLLGSFFDTLDEHVGAWRRLAEDPDAKAGA